MLDTVGRPPTWCLQFNDGLLRWTLLSCGGRVRPQARRKWLDDAKWRKCHTGVLSLVQRWCALVQELNVTGKSSDICCVIGALDTVEGDHDDLMVIC